MNIVDATPPEDFPKLVIIVDHDLATRHPDKGYYLRVAHDNGDIGQVDLDGAHALPSARAKARALGYEPTHWMGVKDRSPTQFY